MDKTNPLPLAWVRSRRKAAKPKAAQQFDATQKMRSAALENRATVERLMRERRAVNQ